MITLLFPISDFKFHFFIYRAQQLPRHGSSVSQQQSTGSGLHPAEDPAAVCPLLQPGQSLRAQHWPSSQKRNPATRWVSNCGRLAIAF